jgi:SAM-dependent methyltransferase
MNQSNNQNAYIGHDELQLLEHLHNYNRSIINKFSKYITPNAKILDFGAGIGTLLTPFTTKYNIKPSALEIDPNQANIIKSKNFNCYEDIRDIENNTYDLIYSSNVFEHIENDNDELLILVNKLKIDGYLCLYLPANNYLWSELDDKVLHFRRYDNRSIQNLIADTRLDIIEIKYCDPIGAIFTLFFKFFNLKFRDIDISKLKIFDRYFLPINYFLEKILLHKFGKNIFIALKKSI